MDMPSFATLHRSRQTWGGLLLALLLALLPLRGWAEASMWLSMAAPQSAASALPVPPCHAAVEAPEGDLPDEAASGCLLCSLCHGADLCQPAAGSVRDAAGTAAAAAVLQGHSPPALPLPERPPRV
ncbi:hypothetical protein [Pseudaquabacterium pictum]|nr:hypothetical protein [Rubrivivax pictus]